MPDTARASLFLTGCRGFIGHHLLRAIRRDNYKNIYCLSRVASDGTDLTKFSNLHWIRAGIEEPDAYKAFLDTSEIVVHLAARTGKARPEEYFQVNAHGTQLLAEQCKRSGVTRFLYVSSIAAKFPDLSRYYYGQSKKTAEDLVRDSGLNYTIIRPTIVLGKESLIWKRLSQLASGRVIVLVGEGTTKIQPIYVDDLVDLMLSLIDEKNFRNETFDLGGPEVISLEDFLIRIHMNYHQRSAPVVRLPLRQLIPALSIIEKYASSLLPFNTGQLAAFANDGTAEPNDWVDRAKPKMKNVDAILSVLTGKS